MTESPSRSAPFDPTEGYYGITRRTAVAPEFVGSRELRYLLVAELIEQRRTMSASELARALETRSIVIRGRGAKAVSDALRWEVAKGRVRKPSRGRFVVGRMPKSTKSWIRGRARNHYAAVTAALDSHDRSTESRCDSEPTKGTNAIFG